MDWWTGLNACTGPGGPAADQPNQIDATAIFDPWLNSDDLDLGTILHQASNVPSGSCSAGSSSSPSTATSASSASPQSANNQLAARHPSLTPCSLPDNSNSNACDQVQSLANLAYGADTILMNHHHHHHQSHHHNQHLHHHQHPHQHQHQTGSSSSSSSTTTTTTTTTANLLNSIATGRQNIFNIFSSASAISSQQSSHQTDNNNHRQQILAPSHVHLHSSSASSTTSPLSSIGSSPLNNQTSYLSPPHSSSSPNLLAPSLGLVDQCHSANNNPDVDPAILQRANHDSNGHHYTDCCTNTNDNTNAIHHHHHHQQQQHQQQQQQQQQQLVNHHHCKLATAVDDVDTKSNIENILHMAHANANHNNNNCLQTSNNNHYGQPNGSEPQDILMCAPQPAILPTSSSLLQTGANSSALSPASKSNQPAKQQAGPATGSGLATKNKSYSMVASTTTTTTNNNNNNNNSKSATNNGQTAQKMRRCRHITDYMLAEEEKRLLIKEGYTDFPMTCQSRPLSKVEERILRKIRRKIRNKKSAQCSRQRKKEYVEDLERKYAAVLRENEELKHIIARIQGQHHQQQFGHHHQHHHHHHHQQQQQQQQQQSQPQQHDPNEPVELDW